MYLRLSTRLWLMLSLAVSILLAGCGSPSSNTAAPRPTVNPPVIGPTLPPAGTPTATALDGTQWRLESLGPRGAQQPVAGTVPLTLEFLGSGRAGGNGGCNTFGGNYTLNGQTIKFSDLVSTLRACTDDALTQQEGRYLGALQSATRYALSGDRLVIEYDGGQSMLNFVQA